MGIISNPCCKVHTMIWYWPIVKMHSKYIMDPYWELYHFLSNIHYRSFPRPKSAEVNILSAANKARRMLFEPKRSFAAPIPSIILPMYFCRPYLENAIETSHPILARDAGELEMCQKLMKGLWHVPYEAALQQLRLSSLTHQQMRGDLISIFKFSQGLLNFHMLSIFTNPTHTGLRGHFNIPHEYSKWGRMNAPYNLWKSAGVISMNDAFIARIIEFAFFAAFAH